MSSPLWWLAAFAAYAGLTVATTWPLAAHLTSAFPNDPFDPALTTWILWWNAQVLPLTARWWNAPMFWPLSGTLALSEHLVGVSIVTTPLQWLGISPLTAGNVAVLLSFPLCAIAAHALAFAVTKRHDAAAIAALVFGFSPYRISHLSHLQMLWTFAAPLSLCAAHRFVADGGRSWLFAFGALWLLQALSNGYAMLFFPVLLVCWLLWFGRAQLLPLGAAWVVASLPLVPFVSAYQRVHARLGLHRSLTEIVAFSADVTSLIAVPSRLIVWRPLTKWSRAEGELFPGALALLLVAVGIIAGIRRARRAAGERSVRVRNAWVGLVILTAIFAVVAISPAIIGPWRIGSWISVSSAAKPLTVALTLATLATMTTRSFAAAWRRRSAPAFYTGGAILMFILSLGPYPTLAGHRILFRAPYAWLMELPGYSSLRVPARFGLLFIICVAVAAACAFAAITERLSRRSRWIAAAAATIVILVESWPAAVVATPPRSIAALGHPAVDGPVVELPIGRVDRDTAALYRSIRHQRPIVNGYSGFVPAHYVILEIALRDDDLDALVALGKGESLIVVIDRSVEFDRWAAALAARHASLIAVDGDDYVYRLAGAPIDRALPSERLIIQSIEANVAQDLVARMLDGDWSTAWRTSAPQQGGETLIVDLGRERHVSALRMDFGALAGDVPRALTVECSGELSDWQPCWRGSALAAAVRGALEEPRLAPMVLPIDRPGVRRLRLRETAAASDRLWSIAELAVLGR